MRRYVVGFLFNEALTQVALVRKNRPAWQAGLLNGIGGKIEPAEASFRAIVREFDEETGVAFVGWRRMAVMQSPDWVVDVFVGRSDAVLAVQTRTDEEIHLHAAEGPFNGAVPNLPWLVPLAREALLNPSFRLATIDFDGLTEDEDINAAAYAYAVPVDQVTVEQQLAMKKARTAAMLSHDHLHDSLDFTDRRGPQ